MTSWCKWPIEIHLLSNSLPSQQRGFLHEIGFLRCKFFTSYFINVQVFFSVFPFYIVFDDLFLN